LAITVKAFFCFVDIGGIVGHQCLNFLLFCWYWWNYWPSMYKLSFVLLILVELLAMTVKAFFCFVDIGGIVGHHCLNFLLFCWYWWNYWPSLLKLSFVLLLLANNSTNINKTKESFNIDGQQFHQYEQNKRKFKHWWSTIPPISTKQKKALTVMANNSTNINKTKES
jgi:hypothetical protein